jgi:hypothetical protein
MIVLLFHFAFGAVQTCDFNSTLERWMQLMKLPSEINNCSYNADEHNYLENLNLGLRGKHILDRRADYEAWVKTEEKQGQVGLRFTFYYFKKTAVQTEEQAKKIAADIEAFAKSSGLTLEKLETKEKLDVSAKNVEWQGFLQFRLKPSRSTANTRYKIHDLDIGLKFRLNRLEFYAILKTPANHPAFDFAKTYATSAVHMLSKGHIPDFSGPSFGVPQSTDTSLSYDSTLGLPNMIKTVHQQLEAI